ncbi:hypothetical protein KHQ82_02165 [Mycoplasmatota bacterium]|nr:hypothetical protein KHQ82_02165 [Mycoplasmatota bacterium]
MLKFLLGLIITIIGIPLLTLFLLLDFTPDIPVDVYERTTPEAIMVEEVNDAIAGIEKGIVSISLKQDNLNNLIYNAIIQEEDLNPEYSPGDECTTNECKFILYNDDQFINGKQLFVGVTGIWTEFYDDVISLNITVSGDYYINFNTSLELQFELLDNGDTYSIAYEKIKAGNIPLPKAILKPVVNLIINQLNVDTNDLNNEMMTVDLSNLKATFVKDELIEEFASDDPTMKSYLQLIVDNELIELGVFEDEPRFEMYLDVEKLSVKSQLPEYLMDFSGTFDLSEEMNQELNKVMLSALAGSPSLNITEETINKVIASSISELGFDSFISEQDDLNINIDVDGVWIEFMDDEMELNLQVDINGVKVLFELNSDVVTENDDLVFTINSAYIGRDASESSIEYIEFDAEEIKMMLSNLNIDNELVNFNFQEGKIVITKDALMSQIEQNSVGVGISDINVEDGMISVGIDLPQQELLNEVVGEVEGVLDELEGGMEFIDETVPEEVAFEEKVSEIAGSFDLAEGETITVADVEELTDLYYELPEETQTDFIEYIIDSIDQNLITNFLDSFMNNN